MAKKTQYRVTRTEKFSVGGTDYNLVAGEIRDDLPEELVDLVGGDYGAVVEATDEDIETAKVLAEEAKEAEEAGG